MVIRAGRSPSATATVTITLRARTRRRSNWPLPGTSLAKTSTWPSSWRSSATTCSRGLRSAWSERRGPAASTRAATPRSESAESHFEPAQVHYGPHLDQAQGSLRHARGVRDRALHALALDEEEPGQNGLRNWFAGFDGPIEYEVRDRDLAVTSGAEVAFCHSLNRLSTPPRDAPQKFNLWFRATVCLRKIDGAWRITHEHNSTPFYMDGSFRAALDLTPE